MVIKPSRLQQFVFFVRENGEKKKKKKENKEKREKKNEKNGENVSDPIYINRSHLHHSHLEFPKHRIQKNYMLLLIPKWLHTQKIIWIFIFQLHKTLIAQKNFWESICVIGYMIVCLVSGFSRVFGFKIFWIAICG